MIVYWTIFVILAAGALLNREETTQRTALLFLVFAALPTWLMIGLRWQIGPDWGSYVEIYDYTGLIKLSDAITHEDPGFYTLNWLLHRFHSPFWYINLACGLIFTAGLTAFCGRQPNRWLAFLVAFPYLVIVVGMSGIRQSAAIGLLFFALNAYERNQLTRCTFLILGASLFHASALLMGPLCALSYSRNRLHMALILIVLVAVAWLLFVESFGVYAVRYSQVKIQSGGIWYRVAMNVLPALIFLRAQRSFGVPEQQRLLWRNLSLASIAAIPMAVLLPSNTAVDRFILYLFPLQSFVLSRFPKTQGEEGHPSVLMTALIIAYAAVVQITFLSLGTYARFYVPYESVFGTIM